MDIKDVIQFANKKGYKSYNPHSISPNYHYFSGKNGPYFKKTYLIELSLIKQWLSEKEIIVQTEVFDKSFLERDKFCFQWRIYPKTTEWFVSIKEYSDELHALSDGILEGLKLLP